MIVTNLTVILGVVIRCDLMRRVSSYPQKRLVLIVLPTE
jgi:hypothetical protein